MGLFGKVKKEWKRTFKKLKDPKKLLRTFSPGSVLDKLFAKKLAKKVLPRGIYEKRELIAAGIAVPLVGGLAAGAGGTAALLGGGKGASIAPGAQPMGFWDNIQGTLDQVSGIVGQANSLADQFGNRPDSPAPLVAAEPPAMGPQIPTTWIVLGAVGLLVVVLVTRR